VGSFISDGEVKMHRNEKEALVEDVTTLLAGVDALYVSDYRGLTVAELTELRGKLRAGGASLRVLKNTLTRMAAERAGRVELVSLLNGPTAITVCGADAVAPAKVLNDFARTHDKLKVRGGLLEGSVLDATAVRAIATLPPREVLIARVVGTVAAPLSGLVTVLQGTIGGFARALQQIADQKAAA
jgi:large subunit ribosomal protein L10